MSSPDASENQSSSQSDGDSSRSVQRRVSVDVLRGMVMFLMLAELMHLFDLASAFPNSRVLEWLRFHTTHVAWEGCSLHDLIQPAFTFLVGVSMPFSIASRLKRGGSTTRLLLHAAWRSFLLIVIGIILRSLDQDRTYFTFEDTLTQIGMGYFFVFLIALAPRWVHYVSAAVVLIGFWLAFALSPPPAADFDYASVGVAEGWPHHQEGLASRWNKNSNLSWKADQWFLNLFPREERFEFNEGGYSTLSFVPTAVTMLFGLIAGVWLRDLSGTKLFLRMLAFTLFCVFAGWLLARLGLCPLVKRIWTPSFTLYSGGMCMAWLAFLTWICDDRQWTRWGFPFVVIGANSILIYVMSWTVAEPIREMLLRHFGEGPFSIFGDTFVPVFSGAAAIAIMYCVLLWLYRRRAFLKI
ncbi:MAG: acyltransferase family protein [Rubripirellula sp.]